MQQGNRKGAKFSNFYAVGGILWEHRIENMSSERKRKQTTWTRQRIEQLIELYQKEECLWNPWNEFYKHKGKRSKAIETICSALHVSKPEFAKKIHNLRNQFNSELKKYEQLLEDAGGEPEENKTMYRCRWVHFQSLMFLKDVIAPRPGTPGKRVRLESSANNSSSAILCSDDIFIEETDDDDQFNGYQEQDTSDTFQNLTSNGLKHETHEILTLTDPKASPTKYLTRLQPAASLPLKQLEQQGVKTTALATGAVIELNGSSCSGNTQPETRTSILQCADTKAETRDQWSAFGEFIATEFRNYHSELSRRKLKRKIMQAMLEISEEDDASAATTVTKLN